MDEQLKDRERTLERLRVDDEIAGERMNIAQKRAVEREMKQKYGRDWKKILGYVGKLKPNREAIQDLYSVNPELRELSNPRGLKKLD